jgi:hypothetical protein
VRQLTGTEGGIGTYEISVSQTVAEEVLSSGAKTAQQGVRATVQLDFHSATNSSGDRANTVSTLFRDEFAVQQFAEQDPNYGVSPLYADDPAQRPFINDQKQYEWRWVVEARVQAEIEVSVPQQYADEVDATLVNVDAAYPPT